MPPRFAYWTILIDNAPTAFRARDPQDLLPTLNQLKRTNKDVAMKWFARGRLWESQQQEHEDFQRRKHGVKSGAAGRPKERRDRDWRPGGDHKDPRARFDQKRRDARERPKDARPHGAGRPPNVRNAKPSSRDRRPHDRQREDRRPRDRQRDDRRPWDRQRSDRQAHRPPREGDRPRSGKPAHRPPPRDRDRTRAHGSGDRPPRGDRHDRHDRHERRDRHERGDRHERREETPEPRVPQPPPRPEPPADPAPEPPPASEQIVTRPGPPERGRGRG